ncbi:hypothetical protein SKAU_G00002900 [Synaphobranchus kaupii]|uniref:Uncharacterized protein n=1 Tax=Synaphobranchus kaupii TaxID=118154 RepID=A0A9Q1JCL1_SYNKA|nr:hypothetical protein SKAU_G00002900 [Synaphobranchus kaupii]
MSQYLKHFTAVGDEQHSTTHWLDEEEHDEALEEVSVQLPQPQHQDPHNFQEVFRRLFIHDKFQIFVVCTGDFGCCVCPV